jgi:hypothetical protein
VDFNLEGGRRVARYKEFLVWEKKLSRWLWLYHRLPSSPWAEITQLDNLDKSGSGYIKVKFQDIILINF